jgi:hypothetical protein
MTDRTKLFLYEAIELRAKYDARIKTLKSLLPEARQTRERFALRDEREARLRPVAAFRPEAAREELKAIELKKRKLNNAIQRANFDHAVTVGGQEMNLVEALELRKAVNEQIGEAAT